jgi:hypothetical protein
MVANLASPPNGVDASFLTDRSVPAQGRIQVVESSPDRLVVYIAHRAEDPWARAIHAFAVAEVAIGSAAVAIFILLQFALPPGLGAGGWLVIGLSVAMAVTGLVRLLEWRRKRLAQLYVSVEPGRFIIQRVLSGQKQIRETILGPRSNAEIIGRGIYRSTIQVNGSERKEELDTALTQREQEWLVDAINRLITPNSAPIPAIRSAKGMIEEIPPPRGLDELRLVPRIVVEEASNERLCYRRPTYNGSWELYAVLVAELLSFAFVESTIGQNGLGGGWSWAFYRICMPLSETVFLLAIATILFGTLRIELTADWLVARWGLGPLRLRRRAATQRISRLVVRYPERPPRLFAWISSSTARTPWCATCLAVDGTNTMTLNSVGDLPTARRIGGILRHELARMGRPTDDV